VGITDNPNQRLRAHLGEAKPNGNKHNLKKCGWIEELQAEHLEPRMRILEIVETKREALDREKYWIQRYLQQGVALTNITQRVVCRNIPGRSQTAEADNLQASPTSRTAYTSHPKIHVLNGRIIPLGFDGEAVRELEVEIMKQHLPTSSDASDNN
jgi:hypothetical protein